MDDGFSEELEAWLEATSGDGSQDADERYEVRRTLKESPSETTQVVYRRVAGGQPIGPFVRKVFRGESSDGPSGLGAAYARIMAAQARGARLTHQPVVYDVTQEGDTLAVVTEFIHGTTLREFAERQGAGTALALRIAPELCEAVRELHEELDEPVIHRDIKPSNVMIAEDGRVMLIDLGIARTWHEDATRDTVRYGTPGYAPPEQFGYEQTTVRSDVYALGMTIAYCLLGSDPTAEIRETGFADPRIPTALQPVLARATQFDPEKRQSSARELGEDVVHALRPHDTPDTRGTERKANWSDAVGRAWNILLLCVWALAAVLALAGTLSPSFAGDFAAYPTWYRAVFFAGFLVVPSGALAYLLLDKRRLRKLPLFAGRTWLQELIVCLVLVVACILLSYVLYAAFVAPSLAE